MTEWVDCRLLPEQHDQLECTSDKPDLYHMVSSFCLTRGTISLFNARRDVHNQELMDDVKSINS